MRLLRLLNLRDVIAFCAIAVLLFLGLSMFGQEVKSERYVVKFSQGNNQIIQVK